MAENEVEKTQNLIIACRERLEQSEKDLDETQKEKNAVLERETKIKKEIKNLKQTTTIAKINAEELFNELVALDSNSEKAEQGEQGFETYMLAKEDTFDRWQHMRHRTTMLTKCLGSRPWRSLRSAEDAKKDFADYLFEFETGITTKTRTYKLRFNYLGEELINNDPLYSYLRVLWYDYPYPGNECYVNYGFDENFYKDLKIKINLAHLNEYPNLETAVMNILKRHEKAENV